MQEGARGRERERELQLVKSPPEESLEGEDEGEHELQHLTGAAQLPKLPRQ